jgi:type IV secretory pathway VirB2 component (pilin)
MALFAAAPAWAAGSNMPWEQPLNQILQSVEGPVAKIIAVMIIIVTGLTLAFGDTSGGARKLIQIVFGLSIAFAASSFFLSFFSFGGGIARSDGRRRPWRRAAGIFGPGAPRADRADPARRRPANARHSEWHARRRTRSRSAPLARQASCL